MERIISKISTISFLVLVILLVTTFMLPSIPAQAAGSDPVYWGVFVGVSDPLTTKIINYADDDAHALYQTLSPVWGTSHTKELIDSVATKAAILDAISWMASNANADDTATFTFSGKGVSPDTICPADWTPVGLGITSTELADALAAVKAKKILVILDCNYSGSFRVGLSKEGRVLMLSSGAGEVSEESNQYQHGIFTYFILQALSHFDTYDINHDHELSAEEIGSFANRMTTNDVSTQNPILDDQVTGDLALLAEFVFAVNISLPTGTTVLILDDLNYTIPPDARFWVPGSTHTMTVPKVVTSGNGTRYVFTGWNGGDSPVTGTISKGSYIANYTLERLLTVISAYGDTTGTGWYIDSSTATFSVTPSIETSDTKHIFNGWSGDFTGTSLTGSLIMNGPKSVTANWRHEYLLTLNSEFGTPTGAGWYDEGATVVISIEPVQGSIIRQAFDGWSGDLTATESSTTIIMNGPKAITAMWRTDYIYLYIVIAAVVVLVAGGIATIVILVWRKGTTRQRVRQPGQMHHRRRIVTTQPAKIRQPDKSRRDRQ